MSKGVAAAVAAVGGYAVLYRLVQTWGSTAQEQRQALAGDELLPDARAFTTHAITFERAFLATIIPADFIMARSHLRGLQRRTEAPTTQPTVPEPAKLRA